MYTHTYTYIYIYVYIYIYQKKLNSIPYHHQSTAAQRATLTQAWAIASDAHDHLQLCCCSHLRLCCSVCWRYRASGGPREWPHGVLTMRSLARTPRRRCLGCRDKGGAEGGGMWSLYVYMYVCMYVCIYVSVCT